MSEKITEFKFTKKEIQILEKFSKINDKVFISPDKIQIIDGTLKGTPDQAANNRFQGGNRSAIYRFETPFFFSDDLGIANLPLLTSTIKSIGDNHTIEVYDRSLIIKDDMASVRFWLTGEEQAIIPRANVEEVVKRSENVKNKVEFKLDWPVMQKIFGMQNIIGSSNTHFFFDDDGDLNIKIAENFEENGSNTATIKIHKDQIIADTLNAIHPNETGLRYNKFEQFKSDIFVEDNYHFILVERAMMLTGDNEDTNYIIKANFQTPAAE
jgi:hypothetical protein